MRVLWCVVFCAWMCVAALGNPGAGGDLPGSERTLVTEAMVEGSLDEVWAAFTVKEEIESWMVPLAEVDFRVGGTMRTNYSKEAGIGGPGTIVHHILAYEPGRMITTRFDAPQSAGDKKLAEKTWVVTRMEPVSPTRTRVTETMVGWGTGEEWDKVYAFFEKGNAWTMDRLVKKFAGRHPADEGRAMELMRTMVGGEWIHEHKDQTGRVARVRNIFELGPDGSSILARGWLGNDERMKPHALLTARLDRTTGRVVFENIADSGGHATGPVTVEGQDTIVWDWNETDPDGSMVRLDIRMVLQGHDRYRMVVRPVNDGVRGDVMLDLEYARVARAVTSPEEASNMGDRVDAGRFVASGTELREISKESLIAASPAEAFGAWTTSEGLKAFLGIDSKIELRIGGKFELYFGNVNPEGQRGSEGCQVLAYVPGEMLAFSWNAPPKFPRERELRTWVVLTFHPEGDKTRVRLVQAGFGTDGEWPQVREYFDRAWGNVLKALEEHYAGPSR